VVLALEPGLYIPHHPRFGALAGVGVRIEDDVLITHAGAQARGGRRAGEKSAGRRAGSGCRALSEARF
jgi:Xaa-Pro aminopeptidase